MSYDHLLTDDEKREILRIARTSLREFVFTGGLPPGKPHKESLLKPAAAFVSLHRGKALRGCIGTQAATEPLYRVVQEMAVAAATRDPRFAAITEPELAGVSIEVSVLGAPSPVTKPEDIHIGRDGISIRIGAAGGLLLPQVATKNQWDAEVFLGMLCEKAGLPDDAWKRPDAEIQRFPAQVFSELDFAGNPSGKHGQ